MTGAGPLELAGDAVHVWLVDLETSPPATPALAEELQRAAGIRDVRRRRHVVASRIWLRVVLGKYLDVDADAVRFARAHGGKPFLVDGDDLCFSHSRSAGVSLIAVTRERSVGVDIEEVRSDFDHASLAERFFTPAEAEELRNQEEPERGEAFFRLWVRKEAVLKASGVGLGGGLHHVDVRADRFEGRWWLASLDAGPGFTSAVAVEGAMEELSMRRLGGGSPEGIQPP